MNHTGFAIVVGALFAIGAAAQSQSGAQAGAQASGQTSVQASKEGAQANASGATATSATAQSGQGGASLAGGSTFNAALNAPLDSKKAKSGDPVTAHCTEPAKSEGKTVLPKGTKVIGHVTQASARGKGDAESSLGVVFDKAILKNGQEVPLNVAIQAVAAAQGNVAAAVRSGYHRRSWRLRGRLRGRRWTRSPRWRDVRRWRCSGWRDEHCGECGQYRGWRSEFDRGCNS